MTDRTDAIALRIFAAMLANGARVTPGVRLGEKEIRIAFMLADTFRQVASERVAAEIKQGDRP